MAHWYSFTHPDISGVAFICKAQRKLEIMNKFSKELIFGTCVGKEKISTRRLNPCFAVYDTVESLTTHISQAYPSVVL